MKHFSNFSALLLLCFLHFPEPVYAQTFVMRPLPAKTTKIGIRYVHANFEKDTGQSVLEGIFDLYSIIPVTTNFNLVLSLPVINVSNSGYTRGQAIGNIYIGIQELRTWDSQNGTFYSSGFYIPTVSNDKIMYDYLSDLGLFTNLPEYYKVFPKTLTFFSSFNHIKSVFKTGFLRIEVGPHILIPTKSRSTRDLSFMGHFAVAGGVLFENFTISGELNGIITFSGRTISFADRILPFAAAGVLWTEHTIQPGVFLNFPLKKLIKEEINFYLGIKIEYSFKSRNG